MFKSREKKKKKMLHKSKKPQPKTEEAVQESVASWSVRAGGRHQWVKYY